ncbi:FAD-NAD(P)-binding [Shewanella psychrophila]|uniref:FAD-NAD(P)-binding n=1 Tax=Shewanella psychrophila TaxID=225848 RepID=A0A1S6HWF1_9GAMM|nr:FAD/NAD(P)-binding protein [Shewanella psychrophila]AQS39885.1 FAD-NAD(P)-binding [Shewanella psychrophila]
MQYYSTCIIGLGPRGLSVLHRILCHAKSSPNINISIAIFEPNEPGVGVHSTVQPDYLLLNTVAGQLSMFPQDNTFGSHQTCNDNISGPTFYEWCQDLNIQIDMNNHVTNKLGRSISSTDYLPRRLVGEYLSFTYKTLIAHCPANVNIQRYADTVNEVTTHQLADSRLSYSIHSDEHQINCHSLFLTLGHTGQSKDITETKTSTSLYPMPAAFSHINQTDLVGIEGLGLAAMDVLSCLTLGRGGKIIRTEKGKIPQYIPSGKEPKICLYSRSGMPFRVRPEIAVTDKRHQAILLTTKRLEQLTANGEQSVDFERDFIPLLLLEMRAVYVLTLMDLQLRRRVEQSLRQHANISTSSFLDILIPIENDLGCFDPSLYVQDTLPEFVTPIDYQGWFKAFIIEDLSSSLEGISSNPVKASLEVWRDLRDTIRAISDFNKLTPNSHSLLYSKYSGIVNRAVGGPQRERHEDLIALMDAGIVEVTTVHGTEYNQEESSYQLNCKDGTNRKMNIIIPAYLDSSGIENSNSSVLTSLKNNGLISKQNKILGSNSVNINPFHQAISENGEAISNIWILGPNVEGTTYYNHYIPTCGGVSKAYVDADIAVINFMKNI